MEENAALQNVFFPFFPFIHLSNHVLFSQPTPIYSFTYSDKQDIYDELQGHPGCGP
jgi:hypothetical protein